MNALEMVSALSVRVPAFLTVCLLASLSSTATAQSSPSAYTTGIRYDLVGRVTGTISPDPDGAGSLHYLAVRNTYDVAGRLTRIESGELSSWLSEATPPASWTGFTVYRTVDTTYNSQNQKVLDVVKGTAGAASAATQYGYDTFGRSQCVAMRMNPAVFASLPEACLAGSEGSFGPDRIVKNIYNTRGDLVTVQKGVGTSLQQDYATYTYSANSNRTGVTDARGYKATMEFDGLDRQTRWYFPAPTSTGVASTTDYEQYGYDANGNRISLRKRDGSTLTYSFDALNRTTVKIVPERSGLDATHTRDVFYGYDSFGRMIYARFDSGSGQGVAAAYNGFGELVSSSNTMPGSETTLTFQFDADGNRTRVTYGDGNFVNYEYDGLDRSNNVLLSGSSQLVSYAYNARGVRASIGGSYVTNYVYNQDGQLSSMTNTPIHPNYNAQYTFTYNPASQITQQTRSNDAFAWTAAVSISQNYGSNGLNQYSGVAGTTQSYDANGNLTSDGATTYVYDSENRLVGAAGAKNATLKYDPMGRLYETTGGSAGLTRFAYDGDALSMEFGSSGSLLRRYVHGTDSGDDPIVWFEGSGFTAIQQRLLRSDHQGSIVAVADATSASILAVNSFDEYGLPGATNQGRFQYTGQTWMAELGLYYYKARMYSPKLGRFMQTDPIGYSDDLNMYAYVGDDPLNKVDPTGLYGQGKGWDSKSWKAFDKAQGQAATDMEKHAGTLDKNASKLDAKGKPGGAAMRAKAATLRAGAAALRSNGSDGKFANAVDRKTYMSDPKLHGSYNGAAKTIGDTIYVNKDSTAWKPGYEGAAQWSVGHESLHTAGLHDQDGPSGARAYKFGDDANKEAFEAIKGTPQADINPDNIMQEVYPKL